MKQLVTLDCGSSGGGGGGNISIEFSWKAYNQSTKNFHCLSAICMFLIRNTRGRPWQKNPVPSSYTYMADWFHFRIFIKILFSSKFHYVCYKLRKTLVMIIMTMLILKILLSLISRNILLDSKLDEVCWNETGVDVEEIFIIVSKDAEPGIALMDQLMDPTAYELHNRSKQSLHHHLPAEEENRFHFYKPYTIS
jgi:hypothetical protein